jgi:hypothetical protein
MNAIPWRTPDVILACGSVILMQGMTALALIGFFNVVGSYLSGYPGGHFSKKYLLSWIYAIQAVGILVFVSLPLTHRRCPQKR